MAASSNSMSARSLPEDTEAMARAIAGESNMQRVNEEGSVDFGFTFREYARFRVSVFRQRGTIGVALRQVPSAIRSLEQLGLPASVRQLLHTPRGLILVTGPTGSGKSTTLAAMLDVINSTTEGHIMTIEDPIEYFHTHKRGVVNQREVGTDVPNFAEGLRRALRQDPDVILVGEMRDLETMETAITAAETGHLVFSTLHTTGARTHRGSHHRLLSVRPAGANPRAALRPISRPSSRNSSFRASTARAASPPSR